MFEEAGSPAARVKVLDLRIATFLARWLVFLEKALYSIFDWRVARGSRYGGYKWPRVRRELASSDAQHWI